MRTPTRAVVIGAHPDDADFGAGGLIALWAAQGCEVTVVCVTDGDSGGFDASVPREDVPGIRRDEQRAGAQLLGAKDCVFLGRPDGFVDVDRDLRRDLARVLRTVRPEAVVTHAPERNYRFVFLYQPDHLATGAAALAAVYPDARNEFALPELDLPPWDVPQVWRSAGRTTTRPSTSPTSSMRRCGRAVRTGARRRCSTAPSTPSCATTSAALRASTGCRRAGWPRPTGWSTRPERRSYGRRRRRARRRRTRHGDRQDSRSGVTHCWPSTCTARNAATVSYQSFACCGLSTQWFSFG